MPPLSSSPLEYLSPPTSQDESATPPSIKKFKHRLTHSIHYRNELRQVRDILQTKQEVEEQETYLKTLRIYGYTIIVITWLMFVISIGTIFDLWQWCFKVDLEFLNNILDQPLIRTIVSDFKSQDNVVENYYIYCFFLNFVVLWIWAVISWISMKLFRHSKGGGS